MKKTILIGVASSMLFLSCLLCRIPVIKADLVSSDGYTIAYQPYIAFPSNYATYDSGFLTLNVSFHGMIFANTEYRMTYSLDGKETELLPLVVYYYGSWIINPDNWERNHIDGSVVLPELSDGSHKITVYLTCDWKTGAGDKHYYDNETVHFTVKNTVTPSPTPSPTPTQTLEPTQSPEPQQAEPFPTTLVIASSVTMAVVCIGSIVYIKKHKQKFPH